jgi:Family of unknown function (DUF6176)
MIWESGKDSSTHFLESLSKFEKEFQMPYETSCVKIKLKPGSVPKAREWAMVINARQEEALATLRDEGVVLECAFLDRAEDGDYLIYVMKAGSFQKAKEAAERSTHEIDDFHMKFKEETWEDGRKLETLIDLEAFPGE